MMTSWRIFDQGAKRTQISAQSCHCYERLRAMSPLCMAHTMGVWLPLFSGFLGQQPTINLSKLSWASPGSLSALILLGQGKSLPWPLKALCGVSWH